MKKKSILLILLILLVGLPPRAEALLDIFTVYGKRNNTIEKIVIEALSTPKSNWVRTCVPIPGKYESSSTYTPKGIDKKDPSICFCFEELYLAKHPSLHNLKDLFVNSTNNLGEDYSFKIIYEDEKSIGFETFNMSNQTAKKVHEIQWIVDLGNSNFRFYTYKTKYENLKEEEKTFWLQLFQYMEDQIKYVPS